MSGIYTPDCHQRCDIFIQGVDVLRKLRQAVYEDINQIQHEEMALRSARLLQENDFLNRKTGIGIGTHDKPEIIQSQT